MMRLLAVMGVALALSAAAPPPAYDIGPAVGATIPALQVTDATGKAQTLKTVTGPKGVVLVFFRSAKWCPFCQAQLMSMKGAPEQLATRGYKMAAISYDAPETLAKFAAARDIAYPLLSDTGSKTIDAFKIRDPQYPTDSFAFGVPEPAIFIVSSKGVVRAKLAEKGYRTRPPLEAVLAAIDALPAN